MKKSLVKYSGPIASGLICAGIGIATSSTMFFLLGAGSVIAVFVVISIEKSKQEEIVRQTEQTNQIVAAIRANK